MQLNPVVISGSGLWTPEHTITSAELVAGYNQWAERFNDQHARTIAIEIHDALGIEGFGFDMLVAAPGHCQITADRRHRLLGKHGWRRICCWLMMGLVAGHLLSACGVVRTTYRLTKGTVVAAYKVTKFAGSTVYTVGEFTFDVVTAPFSWPLIRDDIDTIDGLSPKEAIRQGRVKDSPYVVRGRRYVPMSMGQAQTYRETGIASWYGMETYRQRGGHMTANGEAFNPNGLTAAHKHLPLPIFVRVTNLSNRRSIVVRVNDRGPFIEGRIIDLSAGAAKKLGFYKQGTARVRVEAVQLEG
jgi:rare lipoprotein A